jgi:tripartite-type tricarboxylate transporter receptor subunit TctC
MYHAAFLRSAIALAALLSTTSVLAASASNGYPTRPIRFVIAQTPGSSIDAMGRVIATKMSELLGQQLVVDNRTGAGGTIGAGIVAHSEPDGYTLFAAATASQVIGPQLYKKHVTYDPFKDFAPISMFAITQNILVVNPKTPFKSVKDLIAYAKANPGKLNYSSAGVGASSHLSGALFGQMAGIDIVHVPYRGSGPALQDLLAGNIQMAIDTVAVLLPHIQSGKLRGLGVATPVRNPSLPELPPIAEMLPGFDGSSINYVSGPAGLPQSIVEKLNREINAVLSDPDTRKRMEIAGFTPIIESQPALVKRIAEEQAKWKAVIEKIK